MKIFFDIKTWQGSWDTKSDMIYTANKLYGQRQQAYSQAIRVYVIIIEISYQY